MIGEMNNMKKLITYKFLFRTLWRAFKHSNWKFTWDLMNTNIVWKSRIGKEIIKCNCERAKQWNKLQQSF